MAHFNICNHPYEHKLCVVGGKLGTKIFEIFVILYLAGKWRVDQNNISILKGFKADIKYSLVFEISYIFLKKLR